MSLADLKVRISANADKFDSAMKSMQKRFDKSVRKLERTGKKLTQRVTLPLAAMGAAAVKSSIDFESAFAGVRKTVDATEGQFATLRKGILDMSKELPTSANEIAGVAEAAGQLGIKTDAILEFSKTMVMLGDTTNMAAQEAATALARIANIMQLPQDQFDEMGSVIVDLGNNFATTEAEIVDFASRIAGAGQIAGLAASDIFGIATAMTSVGVEAGLGGTAVQKVMLAINNAVAQGNEDLQTFADTAGVSAEQFQTMWRDDAAEGFAAFVNGLGRQGDNAANTLDELGLADQRLMRAFLSLANAGDLVNRTLDTGEKAWKENTALTKEAEQRYKTIASRLSTLKNRILALGISIGDALMPAVNSTIDAVEGLTIWVDNLTAGAKANMMTIAAFAATAGPLALLTVKLIRAVQAVKALNLAFLSNPFTAVAAAIAAIGAQAFLVHQRINALNAAVSEALTTGLGEQTLESVNNLIAQVANRIEDIKTAAAQIGISPEQNKEFAGLVEKLNSLVELRDDLAQNQIQSLIDEEAAKVTGDTADDMGRLAGNTQRVADAAISAAHNLRELIRLQEAARESTRGQRKADEIVTATGKKLSDMSERGRELFFENPFDEVMLGAQQFGERLQENINKTPFLKERVNEITGAAQLAMSVANQFTDSFGQGMTNLIVQGEKLTDMLGNIGKLLASSIIQKGISLLLTGGLSGVGGFFGSGGGLFGAIFGRDIGGPAFAGQPFLIGQGPHQELFIPDRSGSIVPNNKLRGTGGTTRQVIENHLYIDGREVSLALENIKHARGR